MPNCDFYAAGADFTVVLDFIFKELPCRVFEAYSHPDTRLVEFSSTDDVVKRHAVGKPIGKSSSVHLGLLPIDAGAKPEIRTIQLDPGALNGATFREALEGWGVIQLDLGGPFEDTLVASHTNHNSEKRALKWERTYSDMTPAADWNFSEVTRVSSRLNRFIRRTAVSKVGSRPVLPEARRLIEDGLIPSRF